MRILNRDHEARSSRWGWMDWLLVAASAGLCIVAWRLIGDVRKLRDENESDVRTLRDEYARLERERAELQRQLTGVSERLAQLEDAPTPSSAPVAPSLPSAPNASLPLSALNGTPDAISEASMADATQVKPARAPRRPRHAPESNGTPESKDTPESNGTSAPRKPRARKTPPTTDSSTE